MHIPPQYRILFTTCGNAYWGLFDIKVEFCPLGKRKGIILIESGEVFYEKDLKGGLLSDQT